MGILIGIDSSILVFALDPDTGEHPEAMNAVMSTSDLAMNPTVIHETYHTLVFKRKMQPKDARSKLRTVIKEKRVHCFNITKTISLYSLDLASEFNLGGRDSLIIGCYLRNGVSSVLTHDKEMLNISNLNFRGHKIEFRDPIKAK
jgi:predicted nucleic acid-binding protein